MKKNKRRFLLLVFPIFFTPLFLVAEEEQLYQGDTIRFENSELYVVETTIKHFYYDSLCTWEIVYPQVHGLKDKERQIDLNIMFSKLISIGDCHDLECEPEYAKRFPEHQLYWNTVRIKCIQNNAISYIIKKGGCMMDEPFCHEEYQHFFYDLTEDQILDETSYFKQDSVSKKKLNELIISKLDFVPDDISILQRTWKIDFDCKRLSIFYECDTINGFNQYLIYLSLQEVKLLVNPQGPLSKFL